MGVEAHIELIDDEHTAPTQGLDGRTGGGEPGESALTLSAES